MKTPIVLISGLRALTLICAAVLLSCGGDPQPRLFPIDSPPEYLSDWELMQIRDGELQLAPGLLPYDLATPLFSDHAKKLRTVWMPPGTSARYREHDAFSFPVGTIISKTFYYPRPAGRGDHSRVLKTAAGSAPGFDGRSLRLDRVRMIETRLLIHQPEGWQALPYVWDEAQQQARLRETGAIRPLLFRDEDGKERSFNYIVPNRNECAGCHVLDQNRDELEPIGPRPRHLNKIYAHYSGGPEDQLEQWARKGLLQGLPPARERPSVPVWEEGAQRRIDARARAWLDINCGHCHRPGGAGDTSGLLLHAEEKSLLRMGLCKPPVAAGRGTGGRRYSIVPGQPDASIMLQRILSTEPDIMMPELGRSLVHTEGAALIRRWIESLPGECDAGPRQP